MYLRIRNQLPVMHHEICISVVMCCRSVIPFLCPLLCTSNFRISLGAVRYARLYMWPCVWGTVVLQNQQGFMQGKEKAYDITPSHKKATSSLPLPNKIMGMAMTTCRMPQNPSESVCTSIIHSVAFFQTP